MNRRKIKSAVRRVTSEASARQKDAARKWKQGDDLDLYYDDDDMFPEEIKDFMSPEEKEEFLGDDDPSVERGSATYTLDDIVDTQVLRAKSAPGVLGFIENALDTIKKFMTDDDFADTLIQIKESQATFDSFAETRDAAIKIWAGAASEILGQDASKLPEFSDAMFMNGFLYDFWFMSMYVKPLMRQMGPKKGKDLEAALKSIHSRVKYMTMPNRIKDFIKNVMTPSFEYLTRDTSVMG